MASLPSRPYDALYDPTYTVSGARDHYKQQGQSGGFLISKVPDHANLFSELQHYPRSTFRINNNDKLPAHVDRSFHPHQRQPGQLQQQSAVAPVSGQHQYKYFRRPHLPTGANLTAPVQFAAASPAPLQKPAEPEPLIKDVATQSDYRENETQTLPWSPDWVLPTDPAVLAKQAMLSAKFNCPGPEVLQLADLKFGDGLPGGLQEVRRLEKLRAKRAFEALLPPIDDAARMPERQAMIEAWEASEWQEREEEIKSVQDERLALLENALQVREEEIEAAHRAQVAERSAALLAAKASKFAAIHTARIKTIRQLAAKRKQVAGAASPSSQKASIIDKYADFGSDVYAPPQREGKFPDLPAAGRSSPPAAATAVASLRGVAGPPKAVTGVPLDSATASLGPKTLAALQQLQASLPSNALEPKLLKPKPPAKLSYSQRAEVAVQHDVETVSNMLQEAKLTHGRGIGNVWPYPVQQQQQQRLGSSSKQGKGAAATGVPGGPQQGALRGPGKQPPTRQPVGGATAGGLQRPSTPEAPPLPDPAGRHAALVLLQRLLRGRAVQNEMYAGKMARLQLVRELRLGLEGTAGRLVEFAITKPCSKSCTVVRKHTCNKRIVQCWYTTFILV
eukprot:GHRR01019318.1.p1 GENE.GHRR01019318.1~~GHRR01019318.1.p1  ORF type:complete len:620 (+),score=247.57 GHRR01019318.1:678-2537(+)